MDKNLEKIYREAEECKKKHNYQNFYYCLKKHLKISINDDKDILLGMKMICLQKVDSTMTDLSISTAALILSFGSLITNILDYPKDSIPILIFITIIAVIAVGCVYRFWNRTREKYSKLLFTIEQIEKEMED